MASSSVLLDDLNSADRDWSRAAHVNLPGVELIHAHFSEFRFERHWHDTLTVGVTHAGVQSFQALGSQYHSTQQRVICFNPGVAHDGQASAAHGFRYSMAYVDVSLLHLWIEEAMGVKALCYAATPLIADDDVSHQLLGAFARLEQGQESMAAEIHLRDALLALLERHGDAHWRSARIDRAAAWLAPVCAYLQSHFSEDVSVQALSDIAGVSRVHLTRSFTATLGIAPHAYLNSVRLQKAQHMLRLGMPLAEVAVAAGYADQSHFHRRFKGGIGVSPAQWQAAHRR